MSLSCSRQAARAAHRVTGRTGSAGRYLATARRTLLAPGQTLFPLREVLLAEDRLGHYAKAFTRGTPLAPRFLIEFEAHEQLRASLLVEQARRAVHANDLAVQGFARRNVMKIYPDPAFASNAAGRPLSGFGPLSHVVSVSPARV